MASGIADRYRIVKDRMGAAAERVGRKPGDISLLAVTKTRTVGEIRDLYEAGQRAFGENRVAEAVDKMTQLPTDASWHMIGQLQSNKTKFCGGFVLVHSLESESVARGLNKAFQAQGKVLDVLLEINTGGEEAKGGLRTWDSAQRFIETVQSLPFLRWRGLMTMAPFSPSEVVVRPCFSALRSWQQRLEVHYPAFDWSTLSMGMSNDFEWAIEEGSTLVRVGTALFEAP